MRNMLTLFVGILWWNHSYANIEHFIGSPIDANVVYMVVEQSSEGKSSLDPGVYGPDPSNKKKWKLLYPGIVLQSGPSHGAILQSNLGRRTGYYEAFFVVDGKLVFLSHSPKMKPIIIGAKNAELRDGLSKERFGIPDITEETKFSIYEVDRKGEPTTILCSIDGGESSAPVTILMRIDTNHKSASAPFLSYLPAIIDYKFYDRIQLAKMLSEFDDGTMRIASHRLIRGFSDPVTTDKTYIRSWRKRLATRTVVNLFDDDNDYPFFRADTGQVDFLVFPKSQPLQVASNVLQNDQSIFSVYDPVRNTEAIAYGNAEDDLGPFKTVDAQFVVRAKQPLIAGYDYGVRSVLLPVADSDDEKLLYLTEVGGTLLSVQLPGAWELGEIKNISLVVHRISIGKTSISDTDLVIYSVTSKSGESATYLAKIQILSDRLNATKEVKLSSEFYSQSSLQQRLTKIDVTGEGMVAVVDLATPANTRPEEYNQARKKTSPYIDLVATLNSSRLELVYSEPKRSEILAKEVIFKQFDDPEGSARKTGVYSLQKNGELKLTVPGMLLNLGDATSKAKKGKTDSALLYDAKMGERTDHEFRLSVFALDHKFGNGSNGFTYHAVISNDEFTTPVSFSTAHNMSFANLKGVMVVPVVKGRSTRLHFFYLARDKESEESAILSNHVDIQFSKGKASLPKVGAVAPIQKVALGIFSSEEIQQRLKIANNQELFWCETPTLAPSDPGYRMIDLAQQRSVTLSTSGLRGLSFKEIDFGSTQTLLKSSSYWTGSYASWKRFNLSQLHKVLNQRYKDLYPLDSWDSPPEDQRYIAPIKEVLAGINTPTKTAKQFVLIVEAHEKPKVLRDLLRVMNTNTFKYLSFSAFEKFGLFFPTESTLNLEEFVDNLRVVSSKRNDGYFLLADASDLSDFEYNDERDSNFVPPLFLNVEEEERAKAITPLMLLATAGGQRHSPSPTADAEHHLRSLVVATPQEWESMVKREHSNHRNQVVDHFIVNKSLLNSAWTVLPPEHPGSSTEVRQLADVVDSDADEKVFPEFFETVRNAADINKEAKQHILVMPPDMKSYLQRVLIQRWASNRNSDPNEIWSHHNRSMKLHQLGLLGQQNVDAISSIIRTIQTDDADLRSVILADAAEILKNDPLVSSGKHSFIYDPHDVGNNKGEIPHLLYLLSCGGRLIQPEAFQQCAPQPKASTIIFATEKEYERLSNSVAFEDRFGLLDRWPAMRLKHADRHAKLGLLEALFERPNIRNLGYEFIADDRLGELDSNNVESIKTRILAYMVSRSDMLAQQKNQDPIVAFIRLIDEFSQALVLDPYLRKSRKISLGDVERVLSKSFNIPVNLNILHPEDPMIKLSNPNAAALKLQEAGYEGPLELKLKLIQNVIDQLRPNPVLKVPSSVVVVGDSGSGKTFFFETLERMLGLKSYNFSGVDNDHVQSFKLNFRRLGKTDSEHSSENLTAAEAIKHLNEFLGLPLGYRGFILLDDIDKADPEDFAQIWSFIQTIFETPNGVIKVQTSQGIKEVPVGNLTINITLNPTTDPDQLRRFAPGGTIEEIVSATLSRGKYRLDTTFFKRVGLILKVSRFPSEAKAPKLIASLSASARNDFNVNGRLVLSSDRMIKRLVREFPETDAREFLNDATGSLLSLMPTDAKPGIYMIVPKTAPVIPKLNVTSTRYDFDEDDKKDIKHFVTNNANIVRIDEDYHGRLYSLELMVNSFRNSLIEQFIRHVGNDKRISGDDSLRRIYLGPLFAAFYAHFKQIETIPMRALSLDASDFGVTGLGVKSFTEYVESEFSGPDLPKVGVGTRLGNDRIALDDFLSNPTIDDNKLTRGQVVAETVRRLRSIAHRYMGVMLHVPNYRGETISGSEWLSQAEPSNDEEAAKKIGKLLVDEYLNFVAKMTSMSVDVSDGDSYTEPTMFELARVFAVALDRAIAGIKWAHINKTIVDGLGIAAKSIDVAQSFAVQSYLFTDKVSMMRPSTPDIIMFLIEGSDYFRKVPAKTIKDLQSNFSKTCQRLFYE